MSDNLINTPRYEELQKAWREADRQFLEAQRTSCTWEYSKKEQAADHVIACDQDLKNYEKRYARRIDALLNRKLHIQVEGQSELLCMPLAEYAGRQIRDLHRINTMRSGLEDSEKVSLRFLLNLLSVPVRIFEEQEGREVACDEARRRFIPIL